MKKDKVVLHFLSSCFILLFLFFVVFNCFTYLKCYTVSKNLSYFNNQEFLRIKIYGSTNTYDENTVSGTFSVIDSNGNEIALIERSWSGSYLAVEFAQCKFGGVTYFFPSRIYGKEHIIEARADRNKGTSLEKYYDENGQCMLLGYGSTLQERQNLYTLARFATRKIPVFDFGTTNTYTIDLSPCETEIYYSIKTDIYGNLRIEKF